MKYRILILLLLCVSISAGAQSGKTFQLRSVSLDSLKTVVESNSRYRLFYPTGAAVVMDFSIDPDALEESLKKGLNKSGFVLSIINNDIYILKSVTIVRELPDDYFTYEEDRGEMSYSSNLSFDRVATSDNKIYTIGDPNMLDIPGKITLRGRVYDLNNDLSLPGVSVWVESPQTSAMTDKDGYYSIRLPKGRNDILIAIPGYDDRRVLTNLFEDGELDIVMNEAHQWLSEALITVETARRMKSSQIGLERIQIAQIRHIPTVFGESDVLKVVLNLPGVKSVGEASSGFNVRGGATDQNLVLFNGSTIYNPTHLFGLFSAFNPDLVRDIELYKSTIPSKFGGRISSVLDINNRNGSNEEIKGSLGVGLLTGKFHIEGPLTKSKQTTFITGVRTTYSNWILGLIPEDSGYKDGKVSFRDFTLGLNHLFNEKNTLSAYTYYSQDGFKFDTITDYRYNNMNIALKYRSDFTSSHYMILNAGFDRYNYKVSEVKSVINAFDLSFRIDQFYTKADFNWQINPKHNLNYGADMLYYNIMPGSLTPYGDESMVTSHYLQKEQAADISLYVGEKWTITDKLLLDVGIRGNLYLSMGPKSYYKYLLGDPSPSNITDTVHVGAGRVVKPYLGPEFRISARYIISDRLTIKAGVNTMRQNIHTLSNTVSISPTDTWKLSDADILPQTGWQGAFGIYNANPGVGVELSLEAYYKEMNNYLDYKGGAVINMNDNIEWDVVRTHGRAYGVEFMVKKPDGKLNGWISYTYSQTKLKESGHKESYSINRGKWYYASHDKPHDVKLIGNYRFTKRYSMSVNIDYSSGRPVTVPISYYYYNGGYRLEYSERNTYRIPDYFRLDLSFNIEPSHRLTKLTHSVITFGVYNVTGRKNAYSIYYETTNTGSLQGYQLSIFGAQIPYINYTVKF